MIVMVTARKATVLDAADLKHLSVRLGEGTSVDDFPVELGAPADADHVWLDIAALRDLAAVAQEPTWDEEFDGMIAFARSKGWVSPDGNAVRAHVDPGE